MLHVLLRAVLDDATLAIMGLQSRAARDSGDSAARTMAIESFSRATISLRNQIKSDSVSFAVVVENRSERCTSPEQTTFRAKQELLMMGI